MTKLRVTVLGATKFGQYHVREFLDAEGTVCAILGSTLETSKTTTALQLNPLQVSVSRFMSAINGRGTTLLSEAEVLENCALQDTILAEFRKRRERSQ